MVCYAPSTGTLALIGVGIYIFWHKTIGHLFGMFGTVLEIFLILSVEVAAAILLVWLTRSIRRRRAQSGACTTCRFRCQQALSGRPNRLVNVVDRRVAAPARPDLTCHPTAPLLPARAGAALQRLQPAPLTAARRRLRPAAQPAGLPVAQPTARSAALPAPAVRTPLPRAHGGPRFAGPVPAPFSVRGPVHAPVSPLPPSATRVSSPVPAPEPEPEAVDVDGYVLTPDGVDTPGGLDTPGRVDAPEAPVVSLPN